MRPSLLNPLFADISSIKGIGPAVGKALLRLLRVRSGISGQDKDTDSTARLVVRDLLFHLPSSVLDRRFCPPLNSPIADGSIISAIVTVEKHYAAEGKAGKRFSKKPYRVTCSNTSGTLELAFFNPQTDYIVKALPVGQQRVVSGRVERFEHRLQMTHPDIIAPLEMKDKVLTLDPVYPLTYGMTSRQVGKYMRDALRQLPNLPEWIDKHLIAQQGWLPWKETLYRLHVPQSVEELSPLHHLRCRMAYDELLANQLALGLLRRRSRKQKTYALSGNDLLRNKIRALLPYQLTQGQEQVLEEIDADMATGERMLRLLQGDVGSGKTVVALMAALRAVEAGKQVALMVPTEILGRQHLRFMESLLAEAGVRVAMLTGSIKGKQRTEILGGIETGLLDIIIGTQALFQEKVQFKALALVIIDEQHRFGVAQRMALAQKGVFPHLLLMTATPIPRSLTMTAFGDMDASQLTQKPIGRKPIDTRTVPLTRVEEVIEAVGRSVAAGNKVYWICPLVEQPTEEQENSATEDIAAAEDRWREFTGHFGSRVGLVHGRMKGEEREPVMRGFAGDAYDILVATTVVEVGVDVPDATVIVIEHAERFGLAQLHQLRGRVGRGEKNSSCILLYAQHCGEVARARLRTLRETEDGFRIAEEDLRLRGSGDILGTKQSGLPEFQFADLGLHSALVSTARDDVKFILSQDSGLSSDRGQALRMLLYLYGYDEDIHAIAAA